MFIKQYIKNILILQQNNKLEYILSKSIQPLNYINIYIMLDKLNLRQQNKYF